MKEPGLSKPCKLPGPLACLLHHCQTRLSEDRRGLQQTGAQSRTLCQDALWC